MFLAYLNDRQRHFRMVADQEGMRSTVHLAELFRLADRARLLDDPELAAERTESFPADRVGVVIDLFHRWWDPDVEYQIQRAGPRVFGLHVSDRLVPLPDLVPRSLPACGAPSPLRGGLFQ